MTNSDQKTVSIYRIRVIDFRKTQKPKNAPKLVEPSNRYWTKEPTNFLSDPRIQQLNQMADPYAYQVYRSLHADCCYETEVAEIRVDELNTRFRCAFGRGKQWSPKKQLNLLAECRLITWEILSVSHDFDQETQIPNEPFSDPIEGGFHARSPEKYPTSTPNINPGSQSGLETNLPILELDIDPEGELENWVAPAVDYFNDAFPDSSNQDRESVYYLLQDHEKHLPASREVMLADWKAAVDQTKSAIAIRKTKARKPIRNHVQHAQRVFKRFISKSAKEYEGLSACYATDHTGRFTRNHGFNPAFDNRIPDNQLAAQERVTRQKTRQHFASKSTSG